MKKTSPANVENNIQAEDSTADDLLPEYEFDYQTARPNRFAAGGETKSLTVLLDPDVAEVFTTSEAVNAALRTLIQARARAAKQEAR